jgi:amino acid transporter
MAQRNGQASPQVPHLQRVLTLWDLVFYGIVMVMPIAPVPLFGLIQKLSGGHAVTTILIAMIAMMLTAVSYGRMAVVYPSAGSAYTYVGRALNPHLGFLTGWTMLFDYLLIPILDTIYGALTVQRLVGPLLPRVSPSVLYVLLAALFAGAITILNLRGIRATARANVVMLIVMCGVIGVFILRAAHYLFSHQGWSGILSTQPFYNSATFDFRVLATGTSFAALTYVGFDGVTTLAEDAINPKRNVLMATVLVCLFTGLFGGLQVYMAQRVWPDWHTFPNLETAFMDVCRQVGGLLLFHGLAFILIVANLGGGLTGQVGGARLLFSMGRDNVLPRGFFARLDSKRSTPTYNILLIGIAAFGGALAMNYELTGECMNFGAFLGFMGVNLAAINQFYIANRLPGLRRLLADALVPGLGFLFCLGIWLGLSTPAKIFGGAWLLAGLIYSAIKTRGFRLQPALIDFNEP